MTTLSDLYKIQEALLKIQSGNIPASRAGICFNLDIHLDGLGAGYKFLDRSLQEIFQYPEDCVNPYPIEGNPISYMENDDKWNKTHPWGAKRWETLQNLVDICNREIDSTGGDNE